MYSVGPIVLHIKPSKRFGMIDLFFPLLSSNLRGDAERICPAVIPRTKSNSKRIHQAITAQLMIAVSLWSAGRSTSDLIDIVVPPFRDTISSYELKKVDMNGLTSGTG